MVRLLVALVVVAQTLGGCVSLDLYAALREAYERSEAENRAAKKELAKTSSELGQVQQGLAAATAAREELTARAEGLEALLQQAIQANANLPTQLQAAQAALASKEDETEELTKRAKDLEASLRRATRKNDDLAMQLQAAKAALASKELDETTKTVRPLDVAARHEVAKGSRVVILYDSGSADISPDGMKALERLAEALRGGAVTDKEIWVEGHTDDLPVRSTLRLRYPSNWDLSVARAAGVVAYLEQKAGVSPARLTAVGYGFARPAVPNKSTEARAYNRRVEVFVMPMPRPSESPPS